MNTNETTAAVARDTVSREECRLMVARELKALVRHMLDYGTPPQSEIDARSVANVAQAIDANFGAIRAVQERDTVREALAELIRELDKPSDELALREAKRAARRALAGTPHDATRDLRAMICNDFTDEQLAGGIAQLQAIRANLGPAASDETICGAIYDGMMYPHRKLLGWKNTDPAPHDATRSATD